MAASGPAVILCSKCQAPSGAVQPCAKCGGTVIKVCGKCGFKNSLTKNYCDQCGTAMAVLPPAAPGGAASSSSSTSDASAIPHTEIRRLPGAPPAAAPKAPEGFKLPLAGQAAPRVHVDQSSAADFAPGPSTQSASMTVLRKRDTLHNRTLLLVITMLAAFGVYQLSLYLRPERAVPRLAADYLRALNTGDFDRAYSMFSMPAKGHCSLEEFKAARSATPWAWSDISVARLEPDAVVIRYKLSVEGRPPQDDYLHFVREDGDWVRPYNWNLLQKAESALERNDPDMALLLSQAAVEVNERDAMARGYLCEAVYYRRVAAETERQCAMAIRLSQAYPSKLSMKSLFHLHSILGDTYKDALRRYPEALEEYNTLLAFPDLKASDHCRLLLARSATQTALGRVLEAQTDLTAAAGLCTDPADLQFIKAQQQPR